MGRLATANYVGGSFWLRDQGGRDRWSMYLLNLVNLNNGVSVTNEHGKVLYSKPSTGTPVMTSSQGNTGVNYQSGPPAKSWQDVPGAVQQSRASDSLARSTEAQNNYIAETNRRIDLVLACVTGESSVKSAASIGDGTTVIPDSAVPASPP